MKIICIEEHAIDLEILKAAQPALQREAPYIGLQSSVPRPRLGNRPSAVTMNEAVELGTDIGEGRIREMDDHGIDMQVVSWVSPAQLVPADQALPLAQAANNRLAAAIAANPSRMSGFAVLRLILSGTFEKFPDLQVISGHWGEMAPFFLERLDDVMPPAVTGLSGTISEIYRRHVWVTPSGMFGLPHFALTGDADGMFAGQILMGGVWGVFAALGIIVAQRLLPKPSRLPQPSS